MCLVSGSLDVLIFDEHGSLSDRIHLTPDSPLIDIEPGTWHGMVVRAPDTVIFEVKQGPYDPTTDKTFATWAPPESSPEAFDYLAGLSS
jgi:cupin fold WbuC family metalloprotein